MPNTAVAPRFIARRPHPSVTDSGRAASPELPLLEESMQTRLHIVTRRSSGRGHFPIWELLERKRWAEGDPLPSIPLMSGADPHARLRLIPTRFRHLTLRLVLGRTLRFDGLRRTPRWLDDGLLGDVHRSPLYLREGVTTRLAAAGRVCHDAKKTLVRAVARGRGRLPGEVRQCSGKHQEWSIRSLRGTRKG
jgi:hypothetical protein